MPQEPFSNPAPELGTTFNGKYELRRFLGAGGVGAVYEAVTPDSRHVAVKVLLDLEDSTLGEQLVERFRKEAEITASLDSPNIVTILDAGVDESTEIPFLVMPLLSGLDLESLSDQCGPLQPTVAVRIIRQACNALQVAHNAGIIHRDIKPANIFLDHGSDAKVQVRLLDFGTAKWFSDEACLTRTGAVLGTPHYMSPEQTTSAKLVDARTDVWSLGVSLYQALSGLVPFETLTSFAELHIAINTRNPPALQDAAPWIDPGLATVVHGTLLRDLERRCPTVNELAAALEPYTQGSDELEAGMLGPAQQEILSHQARRAELPVMWQRVRPSLPPPPISQPRSDPLLGKTLADKYRVLRRLRTGGMGAVYETQDLDGNRYALKIIDPERAGKNPKARRRFVREARAVSSIDHQHVVQVVEADTDPRRQTPYILMELLKGTDLAVLIERNKALPPRPVARLFIQACQGLGAAHALGFVHRDIKPSNLFLHEMPSGEILVKVCDFGVAKQIHTESLLDASDSTANLTRSGGMLGSPRYLSPEQAKNAKEIDLRTDIWSLGISLYETLSGTVPWQDCEMVGELILAICTEPIALLQDRAPWIEPELAEVVHRAICRDPDGRYQDMAEFATALAPFAGKSNVVEAQHLVAVPDQVRNEIQPRSQALDITAASGQTAEPTADDAHLKRTQKRRVSVVAVTAVAIATVGGIYAFSNHDNSDQTAATPKATVTTTATPTPTEPSTALDPELVKQVQVQVIPAEATVTVNGKPQALTAGKLQLRGKPGREFEVRISDGSRQLVETVIITLDGQARPRKLKLPNAVKTARPLQTAEPNTTRPSGAQPSTTKKTTPSPSSTVAPPSPPSAVPTTKPTAIETWGDEHKP